MALLSLEAEMTRAKPNWPFSNGYEYESWSDIWCGECAHIEVCPLLTVVIFGRTPATWEEHNPGALNRYHCPEFQATDEEK